VNARRVRVTPGGKVQGEAIVPGDKSISHRWLLLAASARGRSRLVGLPRSLDVLSTAACLKRLVPTAEPAVEAWGFRPPLAAESHGSTWNRAHPSRDPDVLELQGEGRGAFTEPAGSLDCGNSGTTMRLLTGLVASRPFTTVLDGDQSLARRPMERVAVPLREMGADVATDEGHPPLTVRGGALRGIRHEPGVPSAQVKGAVLLAGLAATGTTTVVEPIPTRDHTERLLGALGAPIRSRGPEIVLDGPFEPEGFEGVVPGDSSSAAFLIAAAALTGAELSVPGVGSNPSRLHFVEVLRRMGLEVETELEGGQVGEPVGSLRLSPPDGLRPVIVTPEELPLVIDEVPVLAALAAHAPGPSRFEGAGELRVKESDRLAALVEGLRGLGGAASVDGDTLVIAGGGLRGGYAAAAGDHRVAMALVVSALAARTSSEIEGAGSADVSFPGFLGLVRSLGGILEMVP
jgi:3-phosphoshikimate 1-carboxyvinyltransferase